MRWSQIRRLATIWLLKGQEIQCKLELAEDPGLNARQPALIASKPLTWGID
jgi:hypothetical protein